MSTLHFNRFHFIVAALLLSAIAIPAVVSAAPPAKDDDLAKLSDEFTDKASLAKWQRVHKVEKNPNDQLRRMELDPEHGGRLILEPYTSSWYQEYRGILIHKLVEGDFVVSTRLLVTNKAGNGAPNAQFSLAGLMARVPRDVTPQTWQPGGENYNFIAIGAANQAGKYEIEIKTTQNSRSTLATQAVSNGIAILRIVRVGNAIIVMAKPDGREWRIHHRYDRSDLPRTLQVGLTCYTDWPTVNNYGHQRHNQTVIREGNPDLIADVDYVRYRRPQVPANLKGRDFSNKDQVSDAEILRLFGDAVE